MLKHVSKGVSKSCHVALLVQYFPSWFGVTALQRHVAWASYVLESPGRPSAPVFWGSNLEIFDVLCVFVDVRCRDICDSEVVFWDRKIGTVGMGIPGIPRPQRLVCSPCVPGIIHGRLFFLPMYQTTELVDIF